MFDTDQPGAQAMLIFALVLARVAAMVLIAPVFGSSAVPLRARLVLAGVLALLIVPLQLGQVEVAPATAADFFVLLGAEALVGLMLGLGIMLLVAGIQVAGQIIGQMSGLQLADAFNPAFDASMPAFSQLLLYVTLAVFVAIGGHRAALEALLDTFAWMPPGRGSLSSSAGDAVVSLLTHSFVLGVRAAAPAMLALVLSTLILGLVSRSLPQLGAISLGLGVNAFVALVTLGFSLGAAAWLFQEQLGGVLETVRASLENGSLGGST